MYPYKKTMKSAFTDFIVSINPILLDSTNLVLAIRLSNSLP